MSYLDLLEIPFEILSCMIAFWIISMLYDMLFTIKCKHLLHYEQSVIFNFFLKKTVLSKAVTLTLFSETAIMVFAPALLLHDVDFEMSAIVAILMGLIHIDAIRQNRVFVKKKKIDNT